MKKLLLSALAVCSAAIMSAQTYPYVPISQIKFVSQMDLQNCSDVSAYLGDTVVTRGIVVHGGGLSETASSSVTGGHRPFISIMDTANTTGISGPFESAVIMGVANGTALSSIENLLEGDIIEIIAIVDGFNGQLQLLPLNVNAVSIIGLTNAPSPRVLPVGDLQNNQQQNILTTGEQWQGSYIEIQNVTVTAVNNFTSSGRSRTEFVVQDAAGNRMLVADRFLPMINAGQPTVNRNSPDSVGSFVAPTVGTVFNYIRGVVYQDQNGTCYPGASAFAGGYEINPVFATDFDQAASPANISSVKRTPLIPNASESVTVSADIIDFDGVVTSATLYYTADQTAPANLFTAVTMTNTGSVYSATIPSFPLDSLVRYYIEATDDSSNVTVFPNTPTGSSLNTEYYTVRPNGATIMDIQFVPDVNNTDASPLNGDTVSVTGIVTASYQPGDLGYLYIQDASANEFSGIFVNGGPASVFSLNRGDEVRVVGVVEENFGFTRINADSVIVTGNTGSITPVTLDPSDPNLFVQGTAALEKYEGMLLRYENPNAADRVVVLDSNLGFGEYRVGSGFLANSSSARVLAGRQVTGQAQGSFDVSYVSDTAAFSADMNVTPIQVTRNYYMQSLEGILYYAFGNYKLTPRNNADFGNILVGIETITSTSVETNLYPNPTSNNVTIQVDPTYNFNTLNVQLVDVTGRLVKETQMNTAMSAIEISELEKGMYIVRISNNNELIHSSKLIIR